MLRSFFLLSTLLLMASNLSAQWSDDFTDGDLINGTVWQGNVTDFIVNTGLELQLMAPQAGTSQLYTVQDIPDSTIWSFYIRLDFSPSAANALQLVLQADQADLTAANGYLLDVGETGNQDALRLYRLDSGTPVLLATATAGAMGGSTAICRCRVTRTVAGLWTLEADYTGGQNLQLEFSVQDDTYTGLTDGIFGPVCTYTATRTDKFFFDDFRIEAPLPDLTLPMITDVTILDNQEITLYFSEPVQETEAADPMNYLLTPDLGIPAMAEWSASQPSQVQLVWPTSMVTLTNYTLEAYMMTDTAGNSADTLRIDFPFLKARKPLAGELVLNEIMADPTPVIALPEAEYVEVYNATDDVLDLEGIKLTTLTSQGILPAHLILPDSYVILTRETDVSLFTGWGEVLGVAGFPALTNDGSRLRLLTDQDDLLDEVNYLDDWHTSTSKREGGWSLELIDPTRRCDRQGNWSSSTEATGGTPGKKNSIYQSVPDTTGPQLVQIWPETPSRLILDFDEWVDDNPSAAWFQVLPFLPIDQVTRMATGFQIQLDLTEPLLPGTLYRVNVLEDLPDCQGNSSGLAQTGLVALPQIAEPGDLLINELLFDPPVNGSDFLEVINVSDKYLTLEDLLIGNLQPGKEELKPVEIRALVFPGDHIVLTQDTAFVRATWPDTDPGWLHQMSTPAWSNDSGNVSLFFQDGPDLILLDGFNYNKSMHHPLLDDPEGVSLERVSPTQATNVSDNWQSAAEDAGFATPTRINSQYRDLEVNPAEGFSLESKIFSPDGDSWQDALIIRYQLEESGQILNLKVFDREGRFIQDVANTLYLGREGILVWNGDNENGQAVGPGIYVLWFERYRLNGQVDHFKMTTVLALPLE